MSFPWTENHVAHLRARWTADGAAAVVIAEELGTSKNAVIAKAHRLGFKQAAKKKPASFVPAGRLKPSRSRFPRTTQTVENSFMRNDCFDLPDRPTVDLMELEVGMCKWPYGERPARYCGAPTTNPIDPGCVYCAGHAKLAYNGLGRVEDREDVKEAA